MSIISAMKEYIQACDFLDELATVKIDLMDDKAEGYGLSQVGDILVKRYVNGAELRRASFGLYVKGYTFDDVKRLENSAFCERFIFWLADNSKSEVFPALDVGLTPCQVSAENGMLFDISENGDTGTYQIQINLIYRR